MAEKPSYLKRPKEVEKSFRPDKMPQLLSLIPPPSTVVIQDAGGGRVGPWSRLFCLITCTLQSLEAASWGNRPSWKTSGMPRLATALAFWPWREMLRSSLPHLPCSIPRVQRLFVLLDVPAKMKLTEELAVLLHRSCVFWEHCSSHAAPAMRKPSAAGGKNVFLF